MDPALGPGQAAVGPVGGAPAAGRPGWPAKGQLDYTKTLIEVVLLLLAVPWLVKQLVRHPGGLSKAAAEHHLKP